MSYILVRNEQILEHYVFKMQIESLDFDLI